MSDPHDQKIYEFGDFRMIPVEGLLIRGTTPVQLAPKSFEALVLLIERRGRLVTKDELMKEIWAESFVEESAVSKSIWSIRHALGEDSKNGHFIQTVHKRGYRFIADVSVIHLKVQTGEAEVPQGSPEGDRIEVFENLSREWLISRPALLGRSGGARRSFLALAVLTAFAAIGVLAFYNREIGTHMGERLLFRSGSAAASYKPARGTDNDEAYRLYLEAMYLYDKRGGNELGRAIDLLDRAIQLDPEYASAWAGKALVNHEYSRPGINSTPKEHQISLDAVSKALEIDPNLSDAHAALCQEKLLYEFDFKGAESECQRAVELDPTSPLAHQASSTLYSSRGRFDEAISEIKTAIDLQPASFNSQRFYGNTLYYARRYDEAAAQFERVIAMNPSFRGGYVWLIKTLEMKGDEPKAYEALIKYLNTRNTTDQKIGDAEQVERFRDAWQSFGWRGVAVERERAFDRNKDPYFRRAEWNARLGDEANAFMNLQKAYELHEWGVAFLRVEPAFDSIRSDPRFNDVIAKVESR